MNGFGITRSASNSARPRKDKRFTYVLKDADDTKHCTGVNCLAVLKPSKPDNSSYLFTGSRDGRLKRWELNEDAATCSATFESHVDWVNDAVIVGENKTLVSCSSDSSVKTWDCLSEGTCTRTFRQHTDYVTCLAAAEKHALRVWDLRTGSKMMNLRGHTDNIRSLLLDSTGRFCLSGSSDSMIRLWDLGQQRCVHSYAVHTDSVWALASTPTFSHVYSGGRDLALYITDLATRESLLLCTNEYPIQQLAMHDDGVWVATTDSSVHRWSIESHNPQKLFQKGGSFIAGSLSYSRARASLEGSAPVPLYKEPTCSINGVPGIVQYEILNNKRHVLTKDSAGYVKLWEITRGAVIEDYGQVSFEKKKEALFEMVSVPTWFTVDSRLGYLSVHLETPQCFSAEEYSADLNISEKTEEEKVGLAHETLKGLFARWLSKKKHKSGSQDGETPSAQNITISNVEADASPENDSAVYPPFEFTTTFPPSIITEGSHSHDGPWRKKISEMDGTEDEKDLPLWVLDCILHNRCPLRKQPKCHFYLVPCEGSTIPNMIPGRLTAPPVYKVQMVINYLVEKLVLDKHLDSLSSDELGDESSRSGLKPWQTLKSSIEILCNNQVLKLDMTLATVRAFIWKKTSDDIILHYKINSPGGNISS